MVRYGILMNQQLCTGCRTCMLACKEVHNIPSGPTASYNGRGYYRIWPSDVESGSYPYVVRNENIYMCMQCENPPCLPACPYNALVQQSNNIVVINTAKCTGCQKCIPACPYGAIYYRADTNLADKCDLCATTAGYLDSGNPPECVQKCLTSAIVFGDLSDPTSQISQLAASLNSYVQGAQFKTNPSVYYVYHAAVVHAQLVGTSGAVVPSATVTLTDLASSNTYSQTSDSNSEVVVRLLNVGDSYSLKVTATGYTTYSIAKIQLVSEFTDLGALQLVVPTSSTTTTTTATTTTSTTTSHS